MVWISSRGENHGLNSQPGDIWIDKEEDGYKPSILSDLLSCPFPELEKKALRCDLLHELWSVVGDIVCRRHLLPYAFKETIEKAERIFNERAR